MQISTKEIKAVTFDAGDTLVHLWVHKTRRFAYLCEQIGLYLDEQSSRSAAIVCEKFFQNRRKVKGAKSSEWWIEHNIAGLQAANIKGDLNFLAQNLYEKMESLLPNWTIDPEAITTLKILKEKGFILAVISNWDGTLEQTLQELKILSYFDLVVDSQVVGVRKPKPEIYKIFCDTCNLQAEHCLHVGDSPDADSALARAVQAMPVLYDPLGCLDKEDVTITHLSELVDIIGGGIINGK